MDDFPDQNSERRQGSGKREGLRKALAGDQFNHFHSHRGKRKGPWKEK